MYRMGIFYRASKISNNFLGVLDIPDIFFWSTVDAGSKSMYEEKRGYPPPPPICLAIMALNHLRGD